MRWRLGGGGGGGERGRRRSTVRGIIHNWHEAMPPEHGTTNLKPTRKEWFGVLAHAEGKTNHNWTPPNTPLPQFKHLFTHFTWGAWQLSTNEGDLLRKSCHETGSQDSNRCHGFLALALSQLSEGGGGKIKKRTERKKQTQMSWYRGTSSIPLPLPPSTHSPQPAFKHAFHFLLSCYSFAVLSFL